MYLISILKISKDIKWKLPQSLHGQFINLWLLCQKSSIRQPGKTQAWWWTVPAKWSHVVGSWSALAFRGFLQQRVSISGPICLAAGKLPIFPEGNIVILLLKWEDIIWCLVTPFAFHRAAFLSLKKRREEGSAQVKWVSGKAAVGSFWQLDWGACSWEHLTKKDPLLVWISSAARMEHRHADTLLRLVSVTLINLMCWCFWIVTLPYSGSLWVRRKFYSMAYGTWPFSWAPLKRCLSSWWYFILFLGS